MDFGKGIIVNKGKGVPKKVSRKSGKKAKGIKAKVELKVTEVDGKHILEWSAIISKDMTLPVNKESSLIPLNTTVDLYCNPYTNPTYEEWFLKKDKKMRVKDKHTRDMVNTYWCTMKPGLVIYGEITDKEFILLH